MLKVGLIGFGLGGQAFHAPMIQGTPGLELTCIVARNGNLAQQRYPHSRVVRTVEEMLADEEIRLCVVTTPNTSHFELTRQCLLAGRDVIVDKPFTPTLREAEELVTLAAKSNRLLTVYQDRRWDGDFQTITKIIAAGTLGEITEYECRYDRFRPQLKGPWRERAEPGAGILFDLGPHVIDQALVLFGVPQAVTAYLLHQRGGPADDGFDVALEYPSFRAMLRARMIAAAPTHHFLIHGRNGSFIKYGMDPQEDFLRSPNPPSGTDWGPQWGIEPEDNWGTLSLANSGTKKVKTEIGDYRNYYINVRDAIAGKAKLDVSPQQALNVMRSLELAQKSHRERRTVLWNES
ncbi:MAG TPA: oxidoreductase [Terriglobales bacterium]|nr:oxidoreductase [Terriglobales bacterium]